MIFNYVNSANEQNDFNRKHGNILIIIICPKMLQITNLMLLVEVEH